MKATDLPKLEFLKHFETLFLSFDLSIYYVYAFQATMTNDYKSDN